MAQPATMSRLATGGKDDWCSPEVVLRRVRRIAPIGLDPCTSADNPVGAAAFFTRADDGLVRPWSGYGLSFVNPPYSRAAAWSQRVADSARLYSDEIVSLVAARPDSRWFYLLCWDTAQAVCFWKGRLRFVGAPSSAPFPSALVYHGPRPWAFEAAFADAGRVLRL